MPLNIRLEPLHMQCQTLVYIDAIGEVSGTVEYAVDGSLLLWENEFDCSIDRRKALIEEAEKYMLQRGSSCRIFWDQSRV